MLALYKIYMFKKNPTFKSDNEAIRSSNSFVADEA